MRIAPRNVALVMQGSRNVRHFVPAGIKTQAVPSKVGTSNSPPSVHQEAHGFRGQVCGNVAQDFLVGRNFIRQVGHGRLRTVPWV